LRQNLKRLATGQRSGTGHADVTKNHFKAYEKFKLARGTKRDFFSR